MDMIPQTEWERLLAVLGCLLPALLTISSSTQTSSHSPHCGFPVLPTFHPFWSPMFTKSSKITSTPCQTSTLLDAFKDNKPASLAWHAELATSGLHWHLQVC